MSITNIASNTTARVAAGVLGIAMALSLSFGAVVAPAQAQDAAVIAALQAQIASLMAQLAALSGGSTAGAGVCPYTWTRNLQQGATGADVMKLQQFLNSDSATMVAASGAGSKGAETSTFGPATKAAVIKFQNKYTAEILAPVGLSAGNGNFFASTRAKANSLCTTATTPTNPTNPNPGTGLMVSAAAQPANSLAVENGSRVPFTKFTLTAGNDGDVTVNSVVVSRTGVMNKTAFDGVMLLDENGSIVGTDKVLNSNDQATIGTTMVIPRGTSKTFTVAANMDENLDGEAGEVGGFAVVAINTSATVSGSLPINGATHTVNATLVIGSADVTTSSFDPNGDQSKEIGTTGQRFAGVRITAGSSEDVRIRSIRWYQTGSAGSADLANIKTVVDGTEYNTSVSADGKYYEASFGSGIVVAKGFSAEIYIKGDIVGTGAKDRTIIFNLDKTTDLYITGEKYGYGISPTTSASTATAGAGTQFTSAAGTTNPWFSGSVFTITAGSATSISKANEVPAQNIAVNVQNQVLGGFVTDIKGEPLTVQSMVFEFATTSGSASSAVLFGGDLMTSVSLVNQNGAVVAGPVDAVDGTSGDNKQQVTFSDSVTFPVGKQVYTIKGKLASGTDNNTIFTASTTPKAWTNVKGETTGSSITLTNGAFSMNAMTVKGAALAISVASTPSAQNIVAGAQDFTFAKYQLDATQSGEDVRFSSIPLQLTFATGAVTDLTNCQLFDGATPLNTGSNNVNPSGTSPASNTFTLDSSLTIPKGTIKTLDVKCDVSGAATGTFSWGIAASPSITVTGINSNVDVTETVTASAGQTMTVASGTLAVSLDSSSPSYKMVPANSTDVVVAAYKFRPTNEDVTLRRVGLKLTNTASSSSSDLVRVTLWVGATQIGAATFTGANNNATSTNAAGTGEMSYVLPKDTDTVVTVKADISAIGTNQPAVAGHLIAIDVDTGGSGSTANTMGSGAGSGSTIAATGSTAVSGVRIFKSVPTLTYSTAGATLFNGVNDLLVLNVSSDAKGETQLHKLVFTLATTTVTLASPTFTGPNGNVSSSTNSIMTTGTTITVYFDSTSNTQDRSISAGQTKTYTLRGTITGLTGSNSGSVSTALDADTAFPSLAASTFMGKATLADIASQSIIWSPNSTSTGIATGANDWTNGYGLPGCFASAGLGNDCTARVLAK